MDHRDTCIFGGKRSPLVLACAALLIVGALAQPARGGVPLYTSEPQLLDWSSVNASYRSNRNGIVVSNRIAGTGLSGVRLRIGFFLDDLDPFIQVNPASPNAAVIRRDTPYGGAMRVAAADVTGLLPWCYSWVQNQSDPSNPLQIELFALRLPRFVPFGEHSDPNPAIFSFAFRDLALDSLAIGLIPTAARSQLARFAAPPIDQFTFQPVTLRPVVNKESFEYKLWLWAYPFGWDSWTALFSALILGSLAILYLERSSSALRTYLSQSLGKPVLTRGAVIEAFGMVDYNPSTNLARFYASAQSGCSQLLRCAYIASLAVWLSSRPDPKQIITGFNSFKTTGYACCVRNVSSHVTFMRDVYPSIPVRIVGPATTDLLDEILSGRCYGGVDNEVDLRFQMRFLDTAGKYCPIIYAGRASPAKFPYSVAFSPEFPEAVVDAFGSAMAKAIFDGNYTILGSQANLPPRDDGAACGPYLMRVTESVKGRAQSLNSGDLAGVFLIQGLLMVVWSLFPKLRPLWAAVADAGSTEEEKERRRLEREKLRAESMKLAAVTPAKSAASSVWKLQKPGDKAEALRYFAAVQYGDGAKEVAEIRQRLRQGAADMHYRRNVLGTDERHGRGAIFGAEAGFGVGA